MVRHIFVIILFICFAGVPSLVAAGQPTEQLKPAIDRVLAILSEQRLADNQAVAEHRVRLMRAITERFDFHEMSRRVLGTTWQRITPAQQQQFIHHMTVLLEQAYINKLESYSGESIEFVAERTKGNRAQVTTLITYQGKTIPVHYIMHSVQGRWLVYDINIEGVSLVRNYLEQFRALMRHHSFDDLLQILKAKTQANAEKPGMA